MFLFSKLKLCHVSANQDSNLANNLLKNILELLALIKQQQQQQQPKRREPENLLCHLQS